MRYLLAMLACLVLAGCSVGQPASLAPASRQAIAPVQTFGFNPVVRQAIGLPVGATKCLTGFVTRGITDAVQTLDCVLDTLIPIVTPPQSVIQTGPQSAPCGPTPTYAPAPPPAPRSTPPCEPVATCANGNCGVRR